MDPISLLMILLLTHNLPVYACATSMVQRSAMITMLHMLYEIANYELCKEYPRWPRPAGSSAHGSAIVSSQVSC